MFRFRIISHVSKEQHICERLFLFQFFRQSLLLNITNGQSQSNFSTEKNACNKKYAIYWKGNNFFNFVSNVTLFDQSKM